MSAVAFTESGSRSRAGAGHRLAAIERERQTRGISRERLALSAGITREWYRKVLLNPSRASAALVARLANAVHHMPEKRGAPNRLDLVAAYRNALEKICRELDLDFAAVLRFDPKRGATADPAWAAASRAHALATYFLNTGVGHVQKHIAEAIGVSPAAICIRLRKVEAWRDDPAVDRLLERIGLDLTGEPA